MSSSWLINQAGNAHKPTSDYASSSSRSYVTPWRTFEASEMLIIRVITGRFVSKVYN